MLRNRASGCENFEYGEQCDRLATFQKSHFHAQTFKYVQCYPAKISLADVQESRFQGAKVSNMSSAFQQLGWFADSQESRFYAAKRWDMGSAILQEGWFADAQESSIHVAKRSDMCIVDMKLLHLADPKESRLQVFKRSYMARTALQSGRFADYQD